MTWLLSILGIVGSFIWKLIFGDREKKVLEKEVVEKTSENITLRADLAGKDAEAEIAKEQEQFDDEWKEADRKRKYELLKRDFNHDPDELD